mmetsp:Transcript_42488/g.127363  ORF Transcript_42488/g.127363 Transcript_42488/m.127363 type:complete len:200 (-) Transcript_42488:283-882(-)
MLSRRMYWTRSSQQAVPRRSTSTDCSRLQSRETRRRWGYQSTSQTACSSSTTPSKQRHAHAASRCPCWRACSRSSPAAPICASTRSAPAASTRSRRACASRRRCCATCWSSSTTTAARATLTCTSVRPPSASCSSRTCWCWRCWQMAAGCWRRSSRLSGRSCACRRLTWCRGSERLVRRAPQHQSSWRGRMGSPHEPTT